MRRLLLPTVLTLAAACTPMASADEDAPRRPGSLAATVAAAAADPTIVTLPPVTPETGLATLVDDDGSFAVVDRASGETVGGRREWGSVVSLDRAYAVSAVVVNGGDTKLAWDSLTDGEVIGGTIVEGDALEVTATQFGGHLAALVNPGTPVDGAIADARPASAIVVVGPTGEVWRRELAGNFVPEAFGRSIGSDGVPSQLFLLEYLPAEAPAFYRVRVLSTDTGAVSPPVNIRDKSQTVEERMAGFTRSQVMADEHGLLFTLHTGTIDGTTDGEPYAFVHTLDLADGVWCLIVAGALELDTLQGTLAVGGDELYVASPNGLVGSFDIPSISDLDQMPVMRWVERVHPGGDATPAAVADRERAYLSYGDGELVTIAPDGTTGTPVPLPGSGATALAVDDDGTVHAIGPGWSTFGVAPPVDTPITGLVLAG